MRGIIKFFYISLKKAGTPGKRDSDILALLANIMILYDLKCHFYIIMKFCDFFTLRPFDLITTLTYVLMDNCCPCFLRDQEQVLKKSKSINSLRLGRYKD